MRRTLLALAVLFGATATPVSMFAQEAVSDSLKIEQLTVNQYNQLKRLVYIEAEYKSLSDDLAALSSTSEEMSTTVSETVERLAQSERAINATLESFQQKFEEQNATIEEVQGLLESRMDQLMMYLLGGIALVVVLVLIAVRKAAGDAARKQEASWNSFQEHLLKSK
jgi:peptidoglycan hydrolase CwlO-like protein